MDKMTLLWAGLAFAGFVVGLWVRPVVLLRMGIGLMLLAGLGLLASNLMGFPGAAYWFGAGMIGIAVVFGVAFVGALGGWIVRRIIGVEDQRHRVNTKEYNSIIQ
ncbi:hypothetical protein [Ramlibacter sp.]|uniref:hypothetical protein n=1 Tax=Ramlibacter sp. TaxID=1917967 RepID=UPI003D113024